MPRTEDILKLPVQDPTCLEFSAAHIMWEKIEGGRQGGADIALVPFSRVEDFVKGESSNAECPARFRIESRRKRTAGSVSKPRLDGYLEYILYWCSYGPEDYRASDVGVRRSSIIKPASGKSSRPGRRHMMRGCLCHFTVKRLYTQPHLSLIIYNQRKHIDKSGAPCHGILDHDAVGTRAMYALRISAELRQKIMSMLHEGISVDNIVQHHTEVVQRQGGPRTRDDFLSRSDVRNMERAIRNSSHELHPNDDCSVKIWVQRNKKIVFFFQERSDCEPFVLGIQTDWQLQQMLRYGRNGSVASHSTFGSKKLRLPLCSLLVFDSSQNAIPVAWIIASSFADQDIRKWLGLLAERLRAKDPKWRIGSFLLDNPSFEVSIIREAFQCRVLLCIWHGRRNWMRNLLKKCSNLDVQRKMLKQLGKVLYCTRIGLGFADAMEQFKEIFADQCAFVDYLTNTWLPDIELWINSIRSLPVSTLEANAAIESYHIRLKSKLFKEQNNSSLSRVDWLIHTLTTQFHSSYWLDQYCLVNGYFGNFRDKSILTNAWNKALHIPDVDVMLDESNLQFAKVISQSKRNLEYTIWDPGSEFSLCDCSWSRMGNLCKHVIKVSLICKRQQAARPLLASQVYQDHGTNCQHNPVLFYH
ncbi:uncharacterized protein LOC111797547 [Cucurbita pepo subsp. pepo]|uniref:uncharacterized protein LOC111797547 n=1 Tax=Cucurbita pepo subsp. pepo TaxID=3664 RepID=UPI000C9D2D27|nr:uncharacterized protein LOC111797547 [Cucurbita pepo subsp. pepo]XP_023536352.1 uncharacterized protein LOC111797547 [Cucurbita pepo subsp. pepo]XP_023536353.1 uncharacterized protein LOC111797547 [Cucurbita pepo subsp. pepo]XP_023536354.1 uncharacterized protein LOC111797547 [Cucurbita pepo subsp. pepo]XP_023536355.1 uncharacterized protein LOC111797547 [Cucurbita pepo subsp. pepo]XP_023536356.1 uncharacterized protein LOC111797547 [Cucurbita pepo subsp. pepo]XP_023536357.1 uncharacterize